MLNKPFAWPNEMEPPILFAKSLSGNKLSHLNRL